MASRIVVASGKGGVGKTSLTVALSVALASMGKKTLIIDCDCLRSVDLLLGVGEQLVYDWGDVLSGRCDIEDSLYNAGTPELWVISSPESYEGLDKVAFREMVMKLDGSFDYIFFDAPAGIGEGLSFASAAADMGLVVSTPDLVCVRSACAAARKITSSGTDNVRLIINRFTKRLIKQGKLLNIDSVIDSVEVQLIGIVPEDPKIRLGSMGGNIYKKGQVSFRAITNIAKRIEGESVALS